MQTRHKVSAQKTPPRTVEVQRQIEDDAKLARRIHMQPRSPTKKKNNGILRSQIGKPSITSRRLALDKGVGQKGALRKDASLKTAQAQAGDISVVAAVEQSKVHSESEEDSEAKEANEPENWVGEVAPSSISKRLRSLFKRRVDAQDADKEEHADTSTRDTSTRDTSPRGRT